MDGFVATFVNRLDQKGRVSVPAPFRAVLAREGEEGVYCYPALDQAAIDGGGVRLKEAIAQRLNVFETFSEDYESLSTAFYGESRIPDTATFVGQGFKFQIWEPERFAERQREARAHLRSVTRALGRSGSSVSGRGAPE
jgi:MraZ protein